MTINGLPCYPEKMFEYIEVQQKLVGELYSKMVETFGDINFNSHIQIKRAVRERYGMIWESTAKEVLTDLIYDDEKAGPFASLILQYREPVTRLKTYNEEWIKKHIVHNKLHAKFWQCSTGTGRYSSSDPSLQVIPRDGRWFIGNKPGYKIVAADYSQIEVRVAAYVAQDTALLQALEQEDIHRSIASLMYQVPYSEVTKEQRRHAKAAVFALLYCGGVNRLFAQAREDGAPITHEEAGKIYSAFFGRFTGLRRMRQQAIQMASRDMNIIRMPSTLRRILTGVENRPAVILNNTVQGFAAAGMKQAIRIAGSKGLMDYVGAQVHDELVASVEDRHAEDFGVALKEAMLEGMGMYLPVPVKVEVKSGLTW